MSTKRSTDRIARLAGILLGVALAAVALVSWRVSGGEKTLGADVRVEALQTGPVGVAPIHPFLAEPSLLPGSAVSGSVTLRDQTGLPLRLRLRAQPSTSDLNKLLNVQVSTGSRSLYNGSLGGLRTVGSAPLRLASGQSTRLRVRASLPAGLRSGFQGRIVDINLQIDSKPLR